MKTVVIKPDISLLTGHAVCGIYIIISFFKTKFFKMVYTKGSGSHRITTSLRPRASVLLGN